MVRGLGVNWEINLTPLGLKNSSIKGSRGWKWFSFNPSLRTKRERERERERERKEEHSEGVLHFLQDLQEVKSCLLNPKFIFSNVHCFISCLEYFRMPKRFKEHVYLS